PRPGADPHHAVGHGVGVPLRPADQRHRCAHQPAAPEDRQRCRGAADPHRARRGLLPVGAGRRGQPDPPMMKRLGGMLRSVSSSAAFRLTRNYSILALLTSRVSLFFLYTQSVKILESQFSRQVQITAQRMNAHFEQGGLAGLARESSLEMADHVNTDTEMFMLLDPVGRMLVGNIAWDPGDAPLNGSGVMRSVLLRGQPVHGYLVARKLRD